jgi:hypothetical protein
VAAIVQSARSNLNDNTEPFRYSDDDLLSFVNTAVYEVRRVRPDFFFGITVIPQYDAADITNLTEFAFPNYADPVTDYVVGNAELRDDEFTDDGRAAQLMKGLGDALRGVA